MHKPNAVWKADQYVGGVVMGHSSFVLGVAVGIGDFWNAPDPSSFYELGVDCTTHFQGQFGLAQLIIRNSDVESWSSWYLDNTFPYSFTDNNLGHGGTWLLAYIWSDNPGVSGRGIAFCTDLFKQYYVFKPYGPNSMWVSIGKSYWAWSGCVVPSGFNGWQWGWAPQFWSSQSIEASTEQPVWYGTKSN